MLTFHRGNQRLRLAGLAELLRPLRQFAGLVGRLGIGGPGLRVFAVAGSDLDRFAASAGAALASWKPEPMLTAAIHNAYEAGLGWLVRLKKGEFIGREAAAAIKERGVERKLCCMVTDDPHVALVGKEAILAGDIPVGYVTSAGYGATVGESILFGYLPVEHAEVGTTLGVYSEGRTHPVTVVSDPLFDPANERLKDVAAPAAA